MTPSRESWEGLEKKHKFETYLAIFIEFVEHEAKRIDEENRGLHRKDGGRRMQCHLFLQQLIDQLLLSKDAELAAEIEKLKKGEPDIIELGKYDHPTSILAAVAGYDKALDDVLKLINKGI